MNKSTNEAQLELALADLSKQSIPNFSGTAKRFQVNRTTLRRRFDGSQQSFRAAREDTHQCLTTAQEETLIGFINRLTDRSLPPTSQIVKNVAEELRGGPVGKNWVAQFTRRHKDRLHACYLRTINSKRAKAEYIPLIQKFYDQVLLYILLYI
jgi:Tc5 transposase DNA-binding domain